MIPLEANCESYWRSEHPGEGDDGEAIECAIALEENDEVVVFAWRFKGEATWRDPDGLNWKTYNHIETSALEDTFRGELEINPT